MQHLPGALAVALAVALVEPLLYKEQSLLLDSLLANRVPLAPVAC
jgi:hypothetical protein